MAIEITIPSPGESVTEVTLAAWLKNDGDHVVKDEPLFEIESDKATLSVSAEAAGTLRIKVAQGATVQVGSVAATIEESVGVQPAAPVAPVPVVAGAVTPQPAAKPAPVSFGTPAGAWRPRSSCPAAPRPPSRPWTRAT